MSLFYMRFWGSSMCTSTDWIAYSLASAQTKANSDCSHSCKFEMQPETVPHRTNRTLMSAVFSAIVVLCSALFVLIPMFPRDLRRATVNFSIHILFQDKNNLSKLKCYKTYNAVILVILRYLSCSLQSLLVHPLYYLLDFIFYNFFISVFYIILLFLLFQLHLTLLLRYGIS